jgi:ketosteroid isomerase-like protein/CheY-like chemotaxis protein
VSTRTKVLLIEEELEYGRLLEEGLEAHGFEIDWVRTAPEGVAKLASRAFAVVLYDYLAGRTTDAAQQAHRLLDVAGAVPVVCVSAWRFSADELVDRFACVLYKPCAMDEVLAVVGALVSLEDRPDETRQVLRYFDALTRGDWDALGALCTDDVEYRVPQGNADAYEVVVGRANFKQMARETFASFPDASFEVTEVSVLPRGAVARYTGRWTLPTKQVASVDAAVTFSFSAGRIAGIGVRLDTSDLKTILQANL